MAEMIRPSFEKMAFLGEKARDARFVSRVDATKDKLNVALNPIDPVAERRMNGSVSGIVKGLAESGEWSCDTVRSLVETVNDPTRSANRDVARERLDVLASSTYIVMTHGENEALRQAVGTKDGAVIDAALPESLRGIGGRVAEIATEQEITDPKLKEALKKLDRRADVLRASGSVGEEKLKELIGDKLLELSELVDELDDRGYEELTRVSAYLGAEAERIGGMNLERDESSSMRRQRQRPEVIPSKPGEDGERGWEQRSYDMTYSRFVELERKQIDPNWFPARPPEWYSDMESEQDRDLIDVRIKLLQAAATKHEVRNKIPVEKLRGVKPEISGKEFALLWERMPGFKEAMSTIVRDLCEQYVDPNDPAKRVFLRLKNTNGVMDKEVYGWLSNFDSFREHVAERVASIDGRSECSTADYEAVSVAWNFIFLGDAIESWDYFRQLKPSDVVSDKLRTVFHLRSKFLGKSGIFKVTGLKEESWGEEEPFISNQMFQWVAHNLDANRAEFSDRILRGDLREIIPDTMAVSMIELMPAKLKDGRETSMALALLGKDQNGQEVSLDDILLPPKNDLNIMQAHNDMVQGADWIAQAIKGDQPLDMNKNLDAWAKMFVESTGLIRQEPMIPTVGSTKRERDIALDPNNTGRYFGTLSFPDSPMFFWSILLNSVGFNSTDRFPLLDIKKLASNNGMAVASNYDLALRDMLAVIAVRSRVDKKKVKELLGAASMLDYSKKKMGNDRARFKSLPTV